MNRPQTLMGISQVFQKGGNIGQAQLDAESLQAEKIIQGTPVISILFAFLLHLSSLPRRVLGLRQHGQEPAQNPFHLFPFHD